MSRCRQKGQEMYDERIVRKKGETIFLDGREYEIHSLEGCGGGSLVYRASYPDDLIEEQKHWVLIKELYPRTADHSVRRNRQGRICWDDEEEKRIRLERFRQGNKINLKLLEDRPSQISGNLINCEAYGTYYSILPLHGGETLKRILEGGHEFRLREAVVMIKQILESLKPFHEQRLLHLDISPDNILVLNGWAMLIDFDSIWDMDQEFRDFYFIKKAGYTAPEVSSPGQRGTVSFASDLYSVCAVFFELLTGKRTDELCGLLSGNKISGCLGDSPVFQGEIRTAFIKTAEILVKGLDASPSGRYQNISQLEEELEELLLKIDHKGVSHSSLWECSRRACPKLTAGEPEYLPQTIKISSEIKDGSCGEEEVSLHELIRLLVQGADILLIGPGGMGKTRLLTEAARTCTSRYLPDFPVFYYISLGECQGEKREKGYIRKQLMRHLSFSKQLGTMQDMEHELDQLLDQKKKNQVRLVLLLDGLNEAEESGKGLIPEIEEFSRKRGVSILLTDRTDVVLEYSLFQFRSAVLQPLARTAVKAALNGHRLEEPEPLPLKELLSNPMMLELYIRTAVLERKNGKNEKLLNSDKSILEADDLVRIYLDNQLIFMQRKHHGSRAEQLRDAYILNHILPAAAQKMGTNDLISGSELTEAVKKCCERLKQPRFRDKFPEYRDFIDQVLGGWNETQWYGYAVNQLLELALLLKCGDDSYRLIHDNFKNYLVKRAIENDRKMGATDKELWNAAADMGEFLVYSYGMVRLLSGLMGSSKKTQKKAELGIRPETAEYTRSSYYLDMAERYGVPVGIHPLTKNDIKNMNTYCEIRTPDSQDGRIRTVRYRKWFEIDHFITVALDSQVQSCHYPDCRFYKGNPVAVTVNIEEGDISYRQRFEGSFRTSNDGLERVCDMFQDGTPVSIGDLGITAGIYDRKDVTRMKVYYTEEGYVRYLMFLEGGSGEEYAVDSNGMAGLEYKYDAKGRKRAEYFVNADKERIGSEGVSGFGYVYDKNDDLALIGWINSRECLVNGDGGWSYLTQTYDSFHNVIRTEYYDEEQEKAIGPEGVFAIQKVYRKGCIMSVAYYDFKNKPCKCSQGFARIENTYEQGILTKQCLLDERGKLCEGPDGYAVETVKLCCCKDGRKTYYLPTEIAFWNSARKSCVNTKYGVARWKYELHERGKLLKKTSYGADGVPCREK